MKKTFKFLPLLAASAVVVGCNDYDFGVTADAFRQKEYAENFEKVFGKTDPNQDWSMAATLTANVTVGNNPSVVIYSEKPGHAGSSVLGVVNGKSATFNAIKGVEQVYAIVRENGKTLVSGYYDVVDGAVVINNEPVAKRYGQTRADGDPTLGVKLFTHVAWDTEVSWDGITYRLDGAQFIRYENSTYYLSCNNTAEGPYYEITHHVGTIHHEYYDEPYDYWSYDGGEDVVWDLGKDKTVDNIMKSFQYNADGSPKYYEPEAYNQSGLRNYAVKPHYDAPYYRISDTKTTDSEWVSGDCKTLFWEGDACFKESEDYRSSRKQLVYAEYSASVTSLSK